MFRVIFRYMFVIITTMILQNIIFIVNLFQNEGSDSFLHHWVAEVGVAAVLFIFPKFLEKAPPKN